MAEQPTAALALSRRGRVLASAGANRMHWAQMHAGPPGAFNHVLADWATEDPLTLVPRRP